MAARLSLVRTAMRVSAVSVVWALAVGAASITAGATANSLSLVAFGLDSVVDGSMSAVLVWRFSVERQSPARAQRLERIASQLIGGVLLVAALYVTVQAVLDLIAQSMAQATTFGVVVAGTSVIVLPFLAHLKLRLATQLGSSALRGDGALSAAGAALAAATLLGLALAHSLRWWWADASVALVIAAALALEGRQILGGPSV